MSAKTILYVEDNELNRKIVRDLLKRTSYRLIEAADGEAGIAIALEQRPDLILMDLQLPKVSGLDAVRTLRGARRLPTRRSSPSRRSRSAAITRKRKTSARRLTWPNHTARSTYWV